ncbi:MAG: NAD(P)/FAD-dependent oxidoreductase, partial [Candidatus Omnitrophota bacterium]
PSNFKNKNYQNLLDFFFNDKKLKAILSAHVGLLGLPPNRVSAFAMALTIISYLKDGTFYPKGGAQNLADIIKNKFIEYGGALIINNKIIKVILKNDKIYSITSNLKNTFRAIDFIFSIDPNEMLKYMTTPNSAITKYKKTLNNFQRSFSLFILYLGVEMKSKDIKKIIGWHFKSFDINKHFFDLLLVSSPTLNDKSLCNKDNHHSIEIFQFVNNKSINIAETDRLKNTFIDKILFRFDRKIKNIVFKETASPKTIERYTGNSKGAVYGWENTASQVYKNRLPYQTPISNLYLVGHWCSFGSGIVPVFLTAKKVANVLSK